MSSGHKRHSKFNLKLIKSGLPNADELSKLFGGKSAHGVGGCFSPAIAKEASYMTPNLNVEGVGDSDDSVKSVSLALAAQESRSPPRSVSRKRKSQDSSLIKQGEGTPTSSEYKRRCENIDMAIRSIMSGSTSASIVKVSRGKLIADELKRLNYQN